MRRARLFFKLGAWGFLVTAVFHMVGHFAGGAEPSGQKEKLLLDLVDTVRLELGGVERTVRDFMSGFSWVFALACAFAGVVALASVERVDETLLHRLAILYAAFAGILTALSLRYFIVPPAVCFATVFVLEAVAVGFASARPPREG